MTTKIVFEDYRTRTQLRAAGEWRRRGIDHRTGRIGPLEKGMTPIHNLQHGVQKIGVAPGITARIAASAKGFLRRIFRRAA